VLKVLQFKSSKDRNHQVLINSSRTISNET